MANHKHNGGKVLGMGSTVWGYLSVVVFIGVSGMQNALYDLDHSGGQGFADFLRVTGLLLFFASIVGWIMAAIRGRQAEKEQEGRQEIQKLLSSSDSSSKLTSDPALYKRAQAELQVRKADALKMQELHALRQQVEDEERKAGIFAPTLSPTRSQSDPMAAEMARLAQRKIEAERQKHLMKSLRTVEDAEWEADDV
jgi:hypothetical protein